MTIETLQPSIILTQGTDTAAVVEDLTESVETLSETVQKVVVGNHRMIWCALSHPASGPPRFWSSLKPGTYFDTVVQPSLELARSEALAYSDTAPELLG